MTNSQDIAANIASLLLQIKAIKLSPQSPFTWASGIKSPIYNDNRLSLSYPEVRNAIRDGFAAMIRAHYPDAQRIAGVATGGIAHGMLVADVLNLPFCYVRSAPKAHGLGNMIEGVLNPGEKVLVIEDLISTGGSSLQAIQALREAGAEVIALGAIFTYSFPTAIENFAAADCPFFTLTNYPTMLEIATATGYIAESDKESLLRWYQNPKEWSAA